MRTQERKINKLNGIINSKQKTIDKQKKYYQKKHSELKQKFCDMEAQKDQLIRFGIENHKETVDELAITNNNLALITKSQNRWHKRAVFFAITTILIAILIAILFLIKT